jgi:hypothetical protein
MGNDSGLDVSMLEELADEAARLTAGCFTRQEPQHIRAAVISHLRALAERIAELDAVLAATCEGCADEIEAAADTADTVRAGAR